VQDAFIVDSMGKYKGPSGLLINLAASVRDRLEQFTAIWNKCHRLPNLRTFSSNLGAKIYKERTATAEIRILKSVYQPDFGRWCS